MDATRCTRAAGAWLLVATTLSVAEAPGAAYHDGEPVKLRFRAPTGREKPLSVGPWKLGPSLRQPKHGKPERPSDRRFTLYFVAPGAQHQSASGALDHNLIVNVVPQTSEPLQGEFDLFWVIVLDPRVKQDLRSESELIMLAQERFIPGDLYAVDDAPGAGLVWEVLRAESLLDLKPYRGRDGTLPRILILPAHSIQSATLER